MVQSSRAFLKADRWSELQQVQSDQRRGVPAPPLENPCPDGGALIELPGPEAFTVGQMPLAALSANESSQR